MKQQKLISLSQVEHWLIYHCPLQHTQQSLASEFGLKARDYPFTVSFEGSSFSGGFSAADKTPWQAYRGLATMIWKDPRALAAMTEIYHSS